MGYVLSLSSLMMTVGSPSLSVGFERFRGTVNTSYSRPTIRALGRHGFLASVYTRIQERSAGPFLTTVFWPTSVGQRTHGFILR